MNYEAFTSAHTSVNYKVKEEFSSTTVKKVKGISLQHDTSYYLLTNLAVVKIVLNLFSLFEPPCIIVSIPSKDYNDSL